MQEGLPDMRGITIDERDECTWRLLAGARAIPIAKARREFKPSGSASYDDKTMHGWILSVCHSIGH
jgi:hypothetical protein